MTSTALHDDLLRAHSNNDVPRLIDLYTRAGDSNLAAGNVDAACFYLTHAYIFALEAGSPKARTLNAKLVEFGREVPCNF